MAPATIDTRPSPNGSSRTTRVMRRIRAPFRPVAATTDAAPMVDHLEELRWRIGSVIAVLVGAFVVAFAFREHLFALLNRPIDGRYRIQTFGVTEPFFTAFTVAANTAFIAAFPVLVFNCYRFVSPALSDGQRRGVRPMLVLAPALFCSGVAFCYLLILGPAVRFLLGMGEASFDVTLRAQDYYSFAAMTMLGMGLMFCFPLIVTALGQLGVVTSRQLRGNRRIAIVMMVVVAALLPTADPVSLVIETLPLIALFELSIILVWLGERRAARRV